MGILGQVFKHLVEIGYKDNNISEMTLDKINRILQNKEPTFLLQKNEYNKDKLGYENEYG